MRRKLSLIALCVTAATLSGFGQGQSVSSARAVTAWTNGYWFDGTSFQKRDMYSVDGRLTAKRPRQTDRTVDLAGGYVTPAFGEAHNHNLPAPNTTEMIKTYLSRGIFYVMIQANIPQARAQLNGLINTPGSIDAVFANGVFTAPGGHPSALVERNIRGGSMTVSDRDGGFLLPVSSVADVDRQWLRVKSQRPDFVKMILVYSEERGDGWPPPADSDRYGLDPNKIPQHIVQLAHHDKLRVSAHVESAGDFEAAVAAGVDIVAHMPGFWPDGQRIASKGVGIYEIKDEVAKRAGRQHITVVTTLGGQLRDFESEPSAASYRQALLDVYRHNFAILTKYGVRIAIGSDQYRSTSIPEALAIHKAGLMASGPLLRALSTDTANTILPARSPFNLTEGSPADFLVFDTDPVADFTAIERIRLRVKDGHQIP
jgi:imidazolonepropionase-like amidohydrolase